MNSTLRRYVGGILATVGIFALFFGGEDLTGNRAVSLALLIAGLVSVVVGLKLRVGLRWYSGKHPRTRHVPERGGHQRHHAVPR